MYNCAKCFQRGCTKQDMTKTLPDCPSKDEQVKEQAKVSLEYYNRVLQQLKFTSLGVNSLRAGQLLLVNINDLDGDPFRKYVMLEKVSHTWENDLHTMELEAKAL